MYITIVLVMEPSFIFKRRYLFYKNLYCKSHDILNRSRTTLIDTNLIRFRQEIISMDETNDDLHIACPDDKTSIARLDDSWENKPHAACSNGKTSIGGIDNSLGIKL